MKTCTKCRESKDEGEFYPAGRGAPGSLLPRCKECARRYSREWNKSNPEKCADYQRKMKYGITAEEYGDIMVSQGGLCQICQRAFSYELPAHVDHCHETGEVRGLLCNECNLAIGLLRESLWILQRAAAYVGGFPHGRM